MADVVISLGASDIFSLGAKFLAQTTSATVSQENSKMIKGNGDYQKISDVFNILTSVTATYKYTDITGLGEALPKVGNVVNAYLITSIAIATSQEYPEITITGHQHAANAHTDLGKNLYSIPADIIALLTGAWGVYDFFAKSSTLACATDSNYELSINHIDAECNGSHFVGQNIQGIEQATVNYVGTAATPATVSGWTVTSYDQPTSNVDFYKSTISAERVVARDA